MMVLDQNKLAGICRLVATALILLSGCVFATSEKLLAEENIGIADRHVFMLHPGQDSVWGTYMFGVKNDSGSAATLKHKVSLPDDITDFQPQEGLTAEELKVDTDGGLYFEKEFPLGLTLIAIGFKLSANFGSKQISFQPNYDIADFSVLTKKGGLVLQSDSSIMQVAESAKMANDKYESLKAVALVKAGSTIKLTINNVPQGRKQYWLIGSIFAGLIVLLSLMMTLKTRVAVKEDVAAL